MSHRLCILWNTISPSCFGGAFSSAAPPPATIPGKAITERRIGFCVGNNSDPVTSRSFHEKAVEHSLWDWSGRIACTNWLRGMVPLYHGCNYPNPFGFLPVCAGLTIGLY